MNNPPTVDELLLMNNETFNETQAGFWAAITEMASGVEQMKNMQTEVFEVTRAEREELSYGNAKKQKEIFRLQRQLTEKDKEMSCNLKRVQDDKSSALSSVMEELSILKSKHAEDEQKLGAMQIALQAANRSNAEIMSKLMKQHEGIFFEPVNLLRHIWAVTSMECNVPLILGADGGDLLQRIGAYLQNRVEILKGYCEKVNKDAMDVSPGDKEFVMAPVYSSPEGTASKQPSGNKLNEAIIRELNSQIMEAVLGILCNVAAHQEGNALLFQIFVQSGLPKPSNVPASNSLIQVLCDMMIRVHRLLSECQDLKLSDACISTLVRITRCLLNISFLRDTCADIMTCLKGDDGNGSLHWLCSCAILVWSVPGDVSKKESCVDFLIRLMHSLNERLETTPIDAVKERVADVARTLPKGSPIQRNCLHLLSNMNRIKKQSNV